MRSSADSAPLTLSVPSRLEDVRRLAEFLRAACTAAAIDEMTAFDCELALVEAANNVVEHGYAGVAEGEVSLELTIARDALRMVLSDRGKPVPEGQFDRCKLVPLDAVDGRGTDRTAIDWCSSSSLADNYSGPGRCRTCAP